MSLLIHNATLVLPDRVVPRGYVVVEGDIIAQIGDGSPPHQLIAASAHLLDASHKVLLPGLVNAHTHLEQTFMRGYSANRSLLNWLKNYIWKLQAAMDVDDVRLATTLGLIEAMRGGATTIIDHHKVPFSTRHTDVVLEAAEALGVRLILARAWADRGTNAESPDAIITDLTRLFGEWHGAANGRLQIANGPLVPWRCSAETLQRTTELARKHNTITHCHMNETQDEVSITLGETGLRPVEWFESLGLLGPDFHAVHGVWLSDQEIKLLANHGATVTHCPAANMILASGIAPVARLLRDDIRVALATDGPASNDGQDMFEMMRLTAYMQRVSTLDAEAMSPRTVIGMATEGARVAISPPPWPLGGPPWPLTPVPTGQSYPIGRTLRPLGEGSKADLVLLDFNAAHIQPVGDVLASLVYNCRGSDVDTLIVDGRIIMHNKQFVGISEMALLDECRDRARHLAKRAGITP